MNIYRMWEKFKKLSIHFLQPHKQSKFKRYAFPFLLILIIFPLKLVLHYYNIEGAPYLLTTFIVILSAWYGGLGPGIVATFLGGILTNLLFLEPYLTLSIHESTITTIIFILQGILISMVSEAKRHADLQKDEFISFASHELKNPLAVVKGYLGILRNLAGGNHKKKSLMYLTVTESYVDKINNLINELLDVTKIESGKLSLQNEIVEIDKLVKDLIRDQKLLSQSHKIILTGNTKKKIYCDKTRISQVITNMITNAIKYSPGKKKITVSLSKKKGEVIIAVQDYGIGLSKDAQKKVFERFYRAPDTKAQGLGLGLFIAQQIAVLHGGKIWLESKLHKGTTFFFSLPTTKN